MLKFNILLLVLAVGLIQLAQCQPDTCPYAVAPDGTTYDLSRISSRVHQYVHVSDGYKYIYNISICSPLPDPCSSFGPLCADPYSSGVCQGGVGFNYTRCLGSYADHKIVGLNNGAGIQISYHRGDICGSCNPQGPRTYVITLTCSSFVSNPNKIYWKNAVIDGPQMPPVSYFNGTFYCPSVLAPVSAPATSTNCSNIRAPDGSFYNLSDLMGRVFSTTRFGSNYQSDYNTSFTVCGGISDYCSPKCSYGEAAVCQRKYNEKNPICWGQFDSKATVQGLNRGEGVVIVYDHGDFDHQWYPRKTVLSLNCASWAFPSELYVERVDSDPYHDILFINATIGCYNLVTIPLPSWSPSGNVPNKHVSIQYYGYGTECNRSTPFMVIVNRTPSCYPGCQILGNKFVITACDDDIYLPSGITWVERIYYGPNYVCNTPQSALYTKSRQCGGPGDSRTKNATPIQCTPIHATMPTATSVI